MRTLQKKLYVDCVIEIEAIKRKQRFWAYKSKNDSILLETINGKRRIGSNFLFPNDILKTCVLNRANAKYIQMRFSFQKQLPRRNVNILQVPSQKEKKAKHLKNLENQDEQLVPPPPAGRQATSFPIYTLVQVGCLWWLDRYRFPASLRTIAIGLSSRVLRLHLGAIFGTNPSRVRDGADWKKRCRDGGRNSSHRACWQWAIAGEHCSQDGTNRPWPRPGQD